MFIVRVSMEMCSGLLSRLMQASPVIKPHNTVPSQLSSLSIFDSYVYIKADTSQLAYTRRTMGYSQLLLIMDYSILLSPSLTTKGNRLAFVMLILRIELGLLCHGLGNNTYIFLSHRFEADLHFHRVFRETLTSMPRVP